MDELIVTPYPPNIQKKMNEDFSNLQYLINNPINNLSNQKAGKKRRTNTQKLKKIKNKK